MRNTNATMTAMTRLISILFSTLIFVVPLFFLTNTSELFEFNKMIVVYIATILITASWAVNCIQEKRFVFRKTVLDIPLLLFLGSQLVSTVFSIDQRTSVFGYYSRFNGGLLSLICYALLYWAAVPYLTKKDVRKILISALCATAVASIWGVFEHFGHSVSCVAIANTFTVDCWVQDVQLRVFATFGQPNWMAAWIAAIIPLSFLLLKKEELRLTSKKAWCITVVNILFFSALLFTKSRSGVLAFALSYLFLFVLTGFSLLTKKTKNALNSLFVPIGITLFCLAVTAGVIGSPWTPSVSKVFGGNDNQTVAEVVQPGGTSLETGGTNSGDIRKIVWEGAVNVWRNYPLFGSGVETFAYSYYEGRPVAHNNTSEWNYLYNKAHNEYLNFLATTGISGLLFYTILCCAILYSFYKYSKNIVAAGIFGASFTSILISNFFGFSVVPVSLLFFLLPALCVCFATKDHEQEGKKYAFTQPQILAIVALLGSVLVLMFFVIQYWRADYYFAQAQSLERQEAYTESIEAFRTAIDLAPNEPLYHSELASLYATLATTAEDKSDTQETLADAALSEAQIALLSAPRNVRIIKSTANTYATLGDTNPEYLKHVLSFSNLLQTLAPTDPSVLHQRALTLAKLERLDEAVVAAEEAIALKPDYKIARRLLAFLYEETEKPADAKKQLEYILKNISPHDEDVKKELEQLH